MKLDVPFKQESDRLAWTEFGVKLPSGGRTCGTGVGGQVVSSEFGALGKGSQHSSWERGQTRRMARVREPANGDYAAFLRRYVVSRVSAKT